MKILVVTLSNLGDVVLTLPVFSRLIQEYPDAEIHAVSGASGRFVLENDPRIKKLLIYNRKQPFSKKWEFIKQIRNQKYDLIVDLKYSLIGLLGGGAVCNSYFRRPKHKHRKLRHLDALNSLIGDPTQEIKTFLAPKALNARLESLVFSEPQKKVMLAAVGSKSDLKKWPAESFAVLLDKLAANQNCQIVLVGDASDKADAQKVKGLMKMSAIDVCGQTSVDELLSLIDRASMLITNDSAPLHLADHLKKPVLALFGPTDPKKYGPKNEFSAVARREIFCSPCEKAQCVYSHECMKNLLVDEVYKKALSVLHDDYVKKNLKILIVRLDRIGDVMLTLPMISALKKRLPKAHITLLVRPSIRALIENHPDIDEVMTYAYEKKGAHAGFKYMRFLKEIIRQRFDVAFILKPTIRATLLTFIAGIPYRVGYRGTWSFLLTKAIEDQRSQGYKHESQYAMDLARAFCPELEDARESQLPLDVYEDKLMQEFCVSQGIVSGEKIIAIHAGASCISKRWPEKYFSELCSKILALGIYSIVFIGDSSQKAFVGQMAKENPGRVFDFSGKLDLKQLSVFLKRCNLLVSNDSGPVHIAAAVGVKTLSIFGRNHSGLSVRRWSALGHGHRQIKKDPGCVVCLAHRCTIDFECLKQIAPADVFEVFKEMAAA